MLYASPRILASRLLTSRFHNRESVCSHYHNPVGDEMLEIIGESAGRAGRKAHPEIRTMNPSSPRVTRSPFDAFQVYSFAW